MTTTNTTPILTAVNNAMELAIRQIVRDEMAALLQDLRLSVTSVVTNLVEDAVTEMAAKAMSITDVDDRIEERIDARLREESFITETDVEDMLDRREREADTDDPDQLDEDRVNQLIQDALDDHDREMRDADDDDDVMTEERVEELITNALEDHKSETPHQSEGDIDGRIEELLGQHDFEDAVREALRNLVRSM